MFPTILALLYWVLTAPRTSLSNQLIMLKQIYFHVPLRVVTAVYPDI